MRKKKCLKCKKSHRCPLTALIPPQLHRYVHFNIWLLELLFFLNDCWVYLLSLFAKVWCIERWGKHWWIWRQCSNFLTSQMWALGQVLATVWVCRSLRLRSAPEVFTSTTFILVILAGLRSYGCHPVLWVVGGVVVVFGWLLPCCFCAYKSILGCISL